MVKRFALVVAIVVLTPCLSWAQVNPGFTLIRCWDGTVAFNCGDQANGALKTSSGQLPTTLDGLGYLKIHEQGTAATDPIDRAARALGRAFLRNPGDTANMGDATTPVRVDPTGTTTQPVSGTVSVNPLPAGSSTIGKVDQGAGGASAWKVDGSAVTQPISAASFPLPTNAATDASVTNPQVAAGTTTAPVRLDVVAGRTSDPIPQYQPLPLTPGGAAVPVAIVNVPQVQQVRATNTPLNPQSVREANPLPRTNDGQAVNVLPLDVVGTAASLASANAYAFVVARGLGSYGATIIPGTLAGTVVAECSMDDGNTWVATYFDQQNASKLTTLTFSGASPATAVTIVAMGGCSQYRVRVASYSSGAGVAQLRATMAFDPSVLFAAPQNSANLPPANAVVAGQDALGIVRTVAVAPGGLMVVQTFAAPSLPLPPCNPVRRYNCR